MEDLGPETFCVSLYMYTSLENIMCTLIFDKKCFLTRPNGELYHSKLDDYAIYKYTREEEKIAVTPSQSTRSCGRILFRTGIPDIYVALIEDHEPFLENKN